MSDWDERYLRGEHVTSEPHRLLARVTENSAPGCALDIACGTGRHAIHLAQHGWQVTAVDASRVGIEIAGERARERGVTIDARVADLELGEFTIEENTYDLICVFYYLQRDLFPQLRAGLRACGKLIAAIHMIDEAPEIKPMNPNFLLQPGELRALFSDWQIEHYYETPQHDDDAGEHSRRTAEIVARNVMRDK